MNSVIELHDSWVVGITLSCNAVVVRFGPAYVHHSENRPGFDRGSVWVQDLDLTFSAGKLESSFSELPQELDGGELMLGCEVFENLLRLPLDVKGVIQFSALSINGECLVIRGNSATVVPVGEARYVEQFSGDL
jgi:hypothetical protein